jgi:hypothetical protein
VLSLVPTLALVPPLAACDREAGLVERRLLGERGLQLPARQ